MWRPEDWSEWLVDEPVTGCGSAGHVQAVKQIVRRLPRSVCGRALEVTCGPGVWGALLRAQFPKVLTLDLAPPAIRSAWPRGCDLVLAVDTLPLAELDPLLRRAYEALANGGVFLATLAARPRDAQPFPLVGQPSGAGVHEIELQYRLRRTAFQGLRLRRLRDEHGDTVLCMAVRRGLN